MQKFFLFTAVAVLWIASIAVTHFISSRPAATTQPPNDSTKVIVKQIPEWQSDDYRVARVPGKPANAPGQTAPHKGTYKASPAPSLHRSPSILGSNFQPADFKYQNGEDLVQRNLKFGHVLATLTPENALEYLELFKEGYVNSWEETDPYSDHHAYSQPVHELQMFFHAWARIDGQAAMNHVGKAGWIKDIRTLTMLGWSKADPDAAVAYSLGIKDEEKREKLHEGILLGLVDVDPGAAQD